MSELPPSQPGQEPENGSPQPVTEQPRPQQVRVRWNLPAKQATVTWVLLGITVLVYVGQMISQSVLGGDLLVYYGAKINSMIQAGQWWRLITPMFLHGSIVHIGFNMYALYVLGPGLEKQYGQARFLMLYLIGGFAGNTLSFLLSQSNSLGASTAIFGLAAAQTVFIWQNRKLFGKNARNMLMQTLLVMGVNLLLGLQPGIDNNGHLGGLLGGTIFALLAGPVWELNRETLQIELVNQRSMTRAWIVFAALAIIIALVASFGF